MAHVAFESKLRSVVGHTYFHDKGYCVAIVRVVVYTARAAHIFTAGIKCQHYSTMIRLQLDTLQLYCIVYLLTINYIYENEKGLPFSAHVRCVTIHNTQSRNMGN